MTRIAFLKKYLLKFVLALAMLGLIIYTLGHALGSSAGGLLTTPLRTITDRRITTAQVYLFRDEALLTADTEGLVNELVQSGSKVSKNTSVAQVYGTQASGVLRDGMQLTLDRINRSLRILENSTPGTGANLSEAKAYRDAATAAYAELCTAVQSGELERIATLQETFLVSLNRYLLLAGKSEELDAALDALKTQKAALLTGDAQTVQCPESGVYYDRGYVDGYESLFSLDALASLTKERFEELKKAASVTSQKQVVGKMVYGYAWYAVMEIPQELADSFTVGERYEVSFPENGGITLELTLERTEGALAILRSDDCPTDFTYYRTQKAEIVLDECEGFYIPDSALHTVNGKTGVYVFENSTAYFRRVKLLYRGDGYSIAARPEADAGTEVHQNDILITSGKKLYDGKVYE